MRKISEILKDRYKDDKIYIEIGLNKISIKYFKDHLTLLDANTPEELYNKLLWVQRNGA